MGNRLFILLLSVVLAWPTASRAASHGRGAEESHGGAASETKEDEAAKEGSEGKEAEKTKEEKAKEEAKKDTDAVEKFKTLGDKATEKDLVAIEDKIKELSIKQNAEETPDAERTKLINDLYSTLSQYRLVDQIAATNAANLAAETAAMQSPPIPEAPPPPVETTLQAAQILKIEPSPAAAAPAPAPVQTFAGPVNFSVAPNTLPIQKKISLTPIQNTATAPSPNAPAPTLAAATESLPIRVSSSAPARTTASLPELPALSAPTFSQASDSRPQAPARVAAPISQSMPTPPQEFSAPMQAFENTPSLPLIRSGNSERVATETQPAPSRETTTITITSLDPPVRGATESRTETETGTPAQRSELAEPKAETVAWNPPDVSPEGRALFQASPSETSPQTAEAETVEENETGGELESFRKGPTVKKPKKAAETSDLISFLRITPRR